MKTQIQIIIILLSFNLPLIGQDEFSFVKEGAIWSGYQIEVSDTEFFHYGILGDTIFNGIDYYKVYVWKDSVFDIQEAISKTYHGAVNEENGKVTFISANSFANEPIPIYEHQDLAIGDTLYSSFDDTGLPIHIFLSHIDSVEVCNDWRKRYEYKYFYDESVGFPDTLGSYIWVDGIGSHQGIWSPFGPCFCSDLERLVCYWENDDVCYLTPFFSFYENCHVTFTNIEELNKNITITISPNPVSNQLQIYFSTQDFSNEETFRLINLEGKIIKTFDIPANDMTYMISVENVPSGIYFLQYLKDGVSVKTEQVIISH